MPGCECECEEAGHQRHDAEGATGGTMRARRAAGLELIPPARPRPDELVRFRINAGELEADGAAPHVGCERYRATYSAVSVCVSPATNTSTQRLGGKTNLRRELYGKYLSGKELRNCSSGGSYAYRLPPELPPTTYCRRRRGGGASGCAQRLRLDFDLDLDLQSAQPYGGAETAQPKGEQEEGRVRGREPTPCAPGGRQRGTLV